MPFPNDSKVFGCEIRNLENRKSKNKKQKQKKSCCEVIVSLTSCFESWWFDSQMQCLKSLYIGLMPESPTSVTKQTPRGKKQGS